MSGIVPELEQAYRGRTVWLSGHTGFKGAWLASWLLRLGAKVHGFSLEPPTTPSLFEQIGLKQRLHHEIGDLRGFAAVRRSILGADPDFVFHLGAQALVRASFEAPIDTYATNVAGTVHVMEALRGLGKPCAAVLVTSDKCYENQESGHAYREEDRLGGFDPYSSSKAAAEIAIASWRRSFFEGSPVRAASARAGNCIGGGDWAEDRIVPDCIRALQQGASIPIRNPSATRPWQHVLVPLSGYLWLGAALDRPSLVRAEPRLLESAFNFGPDPSSSRTVDQLVAEVLKHCPGTWHNANDPSQPHEAKLLSLSTEKAHRLLGWKPVWGFEESVGATMEWYRRSVDTPSDLADSTSRQIEQFERDWAATGSNGLEGGHR